MKIRGSSTRAEGDATSEGQTTHILMIQKDDVTYMQMSDEMRQMPGASDCIWLRMEQQNTTGGTAGGAENTDFNTMPPENMTCSPAFFGDDVFATPGRACTMDDLLGGFGATPTPGGTPGAGDVCGYCEMITDPQAKAACLQYCQES